MRELSLFSGAGGGLLGTHLMGWEPVGYVEYDDYCQRVLKARIADGILRDAPIFGDIRAFISEGYADAYSGLVDVVTAGFPCQPFSVAGQRKGGDDDRNMWPQTFDVLCRVRPRFALLENVPGLLAHPYARRIYGDLAEGGFDAIWRRLSAAETGAPHRRDRWFCVAYASDDRFRESIQSQRQRGSETEAHPRSNGEAQSMADPKRKGKSQSEGTICKERRRSRDSCSTVANTEGQRRNARTGWDNRPPNREGHGFGDGGEILADTSQQRLERRKINRIFGKDAGEIIAWNQSGYSSWWITEPTLGRVAHGVANRVDCIKALGNGQVPAVVRAAWHLLTD